MLVNKSLPPLCVGPFVVVVEVADEEQLDSEDEVVDEDEDF
jgi:hypothetical protein